VVVESLFAVALFSGLVMGLVALILLTRRVLLPQGSVVILVNDRRRIEAARSTRLLDALGAEGIHLPSACGGKGTCGQCRITVIDEPPPAVPTETSVLSPQDLAGGVRLACQQPLRTDLAIRVPEEIFGVQQWQARVRSSRFVGTLLKEIVAELPEGERIDFRAGSFVQVTAPPFELELRDLPVDEAVRAEWDRLDLWRHAVQSTTPVSRAYSLANHPGEDRILMLVVRLATPPSLAPEGTPPGIVSSYLFQLEPESELQISGPYGHFFATEGDAEMIFVAGGAGMAPMRSHILNQLVRLGSKRKISFWYGARNHRELFYRDLFDSLQAEHENFRWTVVLSEPETGWQGETGFVHEVLHRRYLAEHPCPERCEYYLCGPPLMARATLSMLAGLGVPRENVFFDDFGA
jgi:Na+-transporting NADH:ubiquinone oxidoreductase subunit F